MEPFDVYCETCHARLRVRHEQFLDQIHPCPKCGSMVHVALPANRMPAPPDVAQGTGPASAIVGVGFAARLAGLAVRHAMVWSVCGAALVVTGGLAVLLIAGGGDEVAARIDQSATPAETVAMDAPTAVDVSLPRAAGRTDSDDAPDYQSPVTKNHQETTAFSPPLPELPPDDAVSRATPDRAASDGPASSASPPPAAAATDPPSAALAERRTLRLEPLEFEPSRAHLANRLPLESSDAATDYPPAVASNAVDVARQLDLPIASIDLPAMPLGEFLEMLSAMAAVPIQLDPAAGVAPDTEVTVRASQVTLGELLEDVLDDRGLAYDHRDGRLVVVRPDPNRGVSKAERASTE